MRKMLQPVAPTACVCGVCLGVLVVAVPLVKILVDTVFAVAGL